MKKTKRANIFFKATTMFTIALMLFTSLAVVNADKNLEPVKDPVMVIAKEEPIVVEPEYTMQIENTSAQPGDTNHTVRVFGKWSTEIAGYAITLYIDTDALYFGQGYATLEGCVGEGAEDFRVDRTGSCIRITVIYTWNLAQGNGIPAGEGCLVNLIFDIEEEAPVGLSPITFNENIGNGNIYLDIITFDIDPHIATTYNGHVEIAPYWANKKFYGDMTQLRRNESSPVGFDLLNMGTMYGYFLDDEMFDIDIIPFVATWYSTLSPEPYRLSGVVENDLITGTIEGFHPIWRDPLSCKIVGYHRTHYGDPADFRARFIAQDIFGDYSLEGYIVEL